MVAPSSRSVYVPRILCASHPKNTMYDGDLSVIDTTAGLPDGARVVSPTTKTKRRVSSSAATVKCCMYCDFKFTRNDKYKLHLQYQHGCERFEENIEVPCQLCIDSGRSKTHFRVFSILAHNQLLHGASLPAEYRMNPYYVRMKDRPAFFEKRTRKKRRRSDDEGENIPDVSHHIRDARPWSDEATNLDYSRPSGVFEDLLEGGRNEYGFDFGYDASGIVLGDVPDVQLSSWPELPITTAPVVTHGSRYHLLDESTPEPVDMPPPATVIACWQCPLCLLQIVDSQSRIPAHMQTCFTIIKI